MKKVKIVRNNTKIDKKYLQNHFEKKINWKIYPDYFEYIDNNNFCELDEIDLEEIRKTTQKVDKVLLKAYKIYIEKIDEYLVWEKAFFKDFLDKNFDANNYLIWRYDVIIDKETNNLKYIEINANTPWMITDICDVAKLLKPYWYRNLCANFPTYIKNKFSEFAWKKLWILLTLSHSDEDYILCQDYKKILSEIFWEENIIIWDIYETNIVWNEVFTIKWEKIDVILNFFPLEYFLTDLDFAYDFFNIIKSWNVKIFNNIESIIFQDKWIFACIWENINLFTKKEQETIKNHIPNTTRTFKDESKYIAKDRWWRISRGTYDSNFYSNIDDISHFIFQEKIYSNIIDENNNFVILWIYTNFKNIKSIIVRKQNVFISNDETIKIMNAYKKN